MQVTGRFLYLGCEDGKKKDGGAYYVVGINQGIDTDKIFVDPEQISEISKIQPLTYVDVTLKIRAVGDKSYTNILSMAPAPVAKENSKGPAA